MGIAIQYLFNQMFWVAYIYPRYMKNGGGGDNDNVFYTMYLSHRSG